MSNVTGGEPTGLAASVAAGLVVSVVVVLVRVMMQIHAHVDRPQSATDWGGLACRSSLIGPSHSGVTTSTPACYAGPPENLERSSRQRDWTAASRGAGARAREAIPRMYPGGQACGLIQSAGAMNGSDDADDRIARLLPEMVRY